MAHVCTLPPPKDGAWFNCDCGWHWRVHPIVGRWFRMVT